MARNLFALRARQLTLAGFIAKGYLDRQLRRALTYQEAPRPRGAAALPPARRQAACSRACRFREPTTRVLGVARGQASPGGGGGKWSRTVDPGLVIGFAASRSRAAAGAGAAALEGCL
jgi:hypothetical protein